ncbi:hypothetical protein [Citricoccus sp. GCM10030269]|uniref:hypothetical protein n=1 Tax=Citricoccus sp. GCM10030269 TaxID=3273388 RepID=UPI00361624E8
MPSHVTTPRRDRRAHRRRLAQQQHEIRRRLHAAPPKYLMDSGGTADESDQDPDSHAPQTGRRRTSLKLMLAATPVALAIVLFSVQALDGSGDPVASPSEKSPSGPAVADVLTEQHQAMTPHPGSGASSAPVAPAPLPRAPTGHRPVAVRIADPAALSLVAPDDRVDVVGQDGSVLAADVAVLQDRSAEQAAVVVLALPRDRAPEVAAAAMAQDLTVVLASDGAR